MSHRDAVAKAPAGFAVTADTPGSPVAAMENQAPRYAVQFHPEVVHTPFGTDLLKWFLFDACDCAPAWTATHVIEDQVARVRAQVGEARAICGLSGGVDCGEAAIIVHRAIGDNLTCVFVNHGLLRLNEGEQVETAFGKHSDVPLVHVDAKDTSSTRLPASPIRRRSARSSATSSSRLRREAHEARGRARFLVQGTLYPDVIESGSARAAATIKTHHNVGGLPEEMKLDLVEPLRELFKDEVRRSATSSGCPKDGLAPALPGPGLAIRIIGEVTPERLEILREADDVLRRDPPPASTASSGRASPCCPP